MAIEFATDDGGGPEEMKLKMNAALADLFKKVKQAGVKMLGIIPITLAKAPETNCVAPPGPCFCSGACEASSQADLNPSQSVVLLRIGNHKLGFLSPYPCDCTGCHIMQRIARSN